MDLHLNGLEEKVKSDRPREAVREMINETLGIELITIRNLTSSNLTISDHLAITMDIDIPTPLIKQKHSITFRNLKSINPSYLSSILADTISNSTVIQNASPTDLVNTYNDALSSCLNQFPPIKTKSVSFTHSVPWFTDQLHHLKSKGR
ncbi:hypothetical protein AAFF_G00353570 [Aldrovandia affinis]|uniref:Uncharacterized protein n=1 Tax=Aldrovandia affinis TaxID=143900 RepID=A0AAD7R5K4_9TELE|nr:hypothetical protein AAFF_G00353570 [Aldrovandia affinis]